MRGGATSIDGRLSSTAFSIVESADTSPMTAYQGFRIFSHVVLGLMSGGIAYAAYIAVTYWTGISV
jgi:hypothetical protein